MYEPTDLDKLKEAMDEVSKYEERIVNKICLDFLSLKNTNINSISKNMYSISFSKLNLNNLSPEYYNVESQTQRIVEKIEKCEGIKEVKRVLIKYQLDKKIKYSSYSINLNPIVLDKINKEVEYLKDL